MQVSGVAHAVFNPGQDSGRSGAVGRSEIRGVNGIECPDDERCRGDSRVDKSFFLLRLRPADRESRVALSEVPAAGVPPIGRITKPGIDVLRPSTEECSKCVKLQTRAKRCVADRVADLEPAIIAQRK